METENKNKPSGIKISLIILISLIFTFIIYYSIMLMLSPMRKLEAISKEYSIKPDENKVADKRILSDSLYLRQLKDKAFLQSRIAMAETDSIYLTINLADSTANIEISGVVVHKTKMKEVSLSRIIMNGNENIILSLLSSPFTISNSISTIQREPVMIKKAPKDTSEYIPTVMPDTSLTEPVNYILEMTNGTRFFVYQEKNEKPADRKSAFRFDLKYRLRDTWTSLKSVAHFKVPEYHPYIKMKIPRADAKIIFRALPKNGQIAVFR
jgi:hypothetical protein